MSETVSTQTKRFRRSVNCCALHTHERFVGARFQLGVLERYTVRLEAYVRKQTEPLGTREQALNVAVVFDTHRAIDVPEHVGVVHQIDGVRRIRVPSPFQIAEPAGFVVVTAVVRAWLEVLLYMIGNEER